MEVYMKSEKYLNEKQNMINSVVKPVMTIREISEEYRIGKDTLYRLVNDSDENSDFPYFKIKSKVLIYRTPFEEWLRKISKENRII